MSAKSKVVDINRKKKELITFTEEELETLRRTVAVDASSCLLYTSPSPRD